MSDVLLTAFSNDYFEARAKFLASCQTRGIAVETYYNPAPGPDGRELSTDVAVFGSKQASNVLVIVSGTHGVEGLAGSGCQVSWIRSTALDNLPDDVAVIIVHMINPWGAAWRRRQTEDNVDLNRNFCDFSSPLPDNPQYAELQETLTCPEHEGPAQIAAKTKIENYRQEAGEKNFGTALFQGQYIHPQGIGFGGQQATWSNKVLTDIFETCTLGAQRLAFIDLHTGLGPFGHGMLISTANDGPELRAAKDWFGPDITAIKDPDIDMPYDVRGDMCSAVRTLKSGAFVVALALEYGTFEVDQFARLQIEDCWLENHGDLASETGQKIRRELQTFFYPATPEWFEMIVERSDQVFTQALIALTEK